MSGVAEMEKSLKRLDRPSFWKWAIPLVLGLVVLAILSLSGATRSVGLIGGGNALVIVVSAMALVRLVLTVLLAMAVARRFRDIGWPAWIGPTILLVTTLGPPLLVAGYVQAVVVGYLSAPDDEDFREWASRLNLISDSVSVVLLIVAGSMPGETARAENIEAAQAFE